MSWKTCCCCTWRKREVHSAIGHFNNIPTMQFFTEISKNTQTKLYRCYHWLSEFEISKITYCGYSSTCPFIIGYQGVPLMLTAWQLVSLQLHIQSLQLVQLYCYNTTEKLQCLQIVPLPLYLSLYDANDIFDWWEKQQDLVILRKALCHFSIIKLLAR